MTHVLNHQKRQKKAMEGPQHKGELSPGMVSAAGDLQIKDAKDGGNLESDRS